MSWKARAIVCACLCAPILAGSARTALAQDRQTEPAATAAGDREDAQRTDTGSAGTATPRRVSFRDPTDGWLDASEFLDTAYGFIPIVAPITEPAVGYGAVGGLMFVDRGQPGSFAPGTRPNIALLGGAGTDNGTRLGFAGHLGTWLDDRLRTIVGVADGNVNLDFFGLGSARLPGDGVAYTIDTRAGTVGASARVLATPVWLGLRYVRAQTHVSLDRPGESTPTIAAAGPSQQLAALTPSITLDTRDNFFTPTSGSYLDLSAQLFRKELGGDRDFDKVTLTGMHFRPLTSSTYLAVRGTARTSSEATPFYLLPYISLRGVPAVRFQGEQAGEVEAEIRWQAHPRFSFVAFGGAGVARSSSVQPNRENFASAAGVGFRYLIAREYGMHMGIDVAQGPKGPAVYFIIGHAWVRP